MEENEVVSNITNEMMFVGALFRKQDLFVNYSRLIRSKYDYHDDVTRFLYDMGELMYNTYSREFSENSINTFMIQDEERKKTYRSYGGYKTIKKIMDISNEDDVDYYYDILKKYSLLREYQRKGFDVQKLIKHKHFATFDSVKITQLMRAKMDKINTVILADKESNDLVENATETIMSYIGTPKVGIPTPWGIINSSIKGLLPKHAMGVGLLSNAGKSRCLMFLAIYVALIDNEKVLIMSNEMSYETMFTCMVTTILNNKFIQEKFGWNVDIMEDDVKLGRYKDDNGNYIDRKFDKNGKPLETNDVYKQRVIDNSSQLRQILEITKFLENKMGNQIFFKDVGANYSDETLSYEINKHNQIYGIKYFFYDTLKCYLVEDWGALKQTLTKLRDGVSEINSFLFYDLQLTPDAEHLDPLELTSLNIASSKSLKHVTDSLFLAKEIPNFDLYKYEYGYINPEWGDTDWKPLDNRYRWYIFKCDKNRDGEKPNVVMRVDLNKNTWYECGVVRKKEFVDKKKKK